MSLLTSKSFAARALTRREALRRASLFLGGAFLGSSIVPRVFGQSSASAPTPPQSVDAPGNPIGQMRRTIADAPLTATKLGDFHYALTGHGGNIGVFVGEENLLVVDSGSGRPPATERLRHTLREISDRPVRYLVNTHWHFDHTDGNANLHNLGAIIVGHRAVRARLSTPQVNAFFNALIPSVGRDALPTVTFDSEMELFVGSDAVHVQHLAPAHTDSDAFVHWPKQNIVQTGDVFFAGMFPFIDASSGGSLEGMIAAEEKILGLVNDSTQIIPGHGPVAKKADLQASLEMLRTVRQRVGKLVSDGKSADEAVALKPLADLDEKWGKGMFNAETYTRLAYSLIKQK